MVDKTRSEAAKKGWETRRAKKAHALKVEAIVSQQALRVNHDIIKKRELSQEVTALQDDIYKTSMDAAYELHKAIQETRLKHLRMKWNASLWKRFRSKAVYSCLYLSAEAFIKQAIFSKSIEDYKEECELQGWEFHGASDAQVNLIQRFEARFVGINQILDWLVIDLKHQPGYIRSAMDRIVHELATSKGSEFKDKMADGYHVDTADDAIMEQIAFDAYNRTHNRDGSLSDEDIKELMDEEQKMREAEAEMEIQTRMTIEQAAAPVIKAEWYRMLDLIEERLRYMNMDTPKRQAVSLFRDDEWHDADKTVFKWKTDVMYFMRLMTACRNSFNAVILDLALVAQGKRPEYWKGNITRPMKLEAAHLSRSYNDIFKAKMAKYDETVESLKTMLYEVTGNQNQVTEEQQSSNDLERSAGWGEDRESNSEYHYDAELI